MADSSDVVNTLVGLIAGAIYPNGTSAASAIGVTVHTVPGWPIPASLAADIAKGICQVSVYPLQSERNTTRYPLAWQTVTVNAPTLVLTIAGQTVTVSGNVPPASANNPHNVMVLANRAPYVYAVQPTDTLNSVAAALATTIAVGIPGTTSSGPVITLPSSALIAAARVGVTGTSLMETRRQDKQFQISIWADIPDSRVAIARALDAFFPLMRFINLPDLTAGRLIYQRTWETDVVQKQQIYRRDQIYSVEYGTTITQVGTQVTETQLNVAAAVAGVPPFVNVDTIYD
jgi:hypothetical protein